MLHSIYQQIWKTQQWPQDWKRSVFIPIPKKGNTKEFSNYHTVALISLTSKVMLKILQVRPQQYVNWELPDVQAGFRKGRGTRDQIANIQWIFLTQELNGGLLHFRQILYQLSYQGSPFSYASKVILKILQVRLQHHMNWELPDVQAGLWRGRGTRDQIANIRWIIEKAREFQKNICCCC